MSETLFDQLGGAAAVNAAVDIFYQKVLADGSLSPFFEGVSMQDQRDKQKAFLTVAFGGPYDYVGNDLTSSHARAVKRGLSDRHVNAVLGHLMKTLQELKVSGYLVVEIMKIAESTRNAVLGR